MRGFDITPSFSHFVISKLEGEINEKLQNIHSQLFQANAEQRESERDRSFKDNLENLQRIFPGQSQRSETILPTDIL